LTHGLGWVADGYRFFRRSTGTPRYVPPEVHVRRREDARRKQWQKRWRRAAQRFSLQHRSTRCWLPGCCNLLSPLGAERRFCEDKHSSRYHWLQDRRAAIAARWLAEFMSGARPAHCQRPGCANLFDFHPRVGGKGPQRYCSNNCNQGAYRARKAHRKAGTLGGGVAGAGATGEHE